MRHIFLNTLFGSQKKCIPIYLDCKWTAQNEKHSFTLEYMQIKSKRKN